MFFKRIFNIIVVIFIFWFLVIVLVFMFNSEVMWELFIMLNVFVVLDSENY